MAVRTLDAKLKLENAEAKKKAREVGEAAADGMTKAAEAAERTASATERMAENTKKAADSTTKAATSAEMSAKTLSRFALSMGGMLVGAAANAVAAAMPESGLQRGLAAGGKVLGGASQGAAAGATMGPWGMAIGGALGAGAAGINLFADGMEEERKKQEAIRQTNAANRELYETMLEAQAKTDAFRTTIDSLGDTEKSLAERQAEVAAAIEKREAEEKRLKLGMFYNSSQGADAAAQKLFAQQTKDYAANHGELEQLKRLQKSLNAESGSERLSLGATDAITRLGGAFTVGSADVGRDQLKVAGEQLAVLKSIDSKTGGGGTWQ